MQVASTSEELMVCFKKHTDETKQHIANLEAIFELLEERADEKKSKIMRSLLEEAEDIISDTERNSYTRDAALIMAAQKVEQYEIATYGTLRTFAENMRHEDVEKLLEQILENEKATDQALTSIAKGFVSIYAADE